MRTCCRRNIEWLVLILVLLRPMPVRAASGDMIGKARQPSTAVAIALTPFGLARDLVDLGLRPLSAPVWFVSLSHSTMTMLAITPVPFVLLTNAAIAFPGTAQGDGWQHVLQPFSAGFAPFPNMRAIWGSAE